MPRLGDSVADANPTPFWLDRPEFPAPSMRPPVDQRRRVDLLIIGAGFTGLWAAYEAARAGRSVLVVDQGAIGGAASGRCGGFINASITHGIPHGHARWPDEMPTILAIQRALWTDTIRLIEQVAPGVIEPVGKLTVATRPHHVAAVNDGAALLADYDEEVSTLDAEQLGALVHSPTYLAGYHLRSHNGVCDPARLAWAQATLAERAGAVIAEHTAVRAIDRDGSGVEARLGSGLTIQANQALVATNAAPPLLRRLRSLIIPVYDHVIVTEPLSGELWHEIGWRSPAGITDAGNQFHYYRKTPDGRILFGGWEATYHFGGRVDARHERAPDVHALLADHLVETFPALESTAVTHAWGGAIDSTTRFTPTMHTAWDGRLAWAVGFTGLGVGASRFAALAALDLLAGATTARTELSMVRRQPMPFPPEPLRWPLVQFTKRALVAEDRTGRRGLWLRLLDRFGVGFDT